MVYLVNDRFFSVAGSRNTSYDAVGVGGTQEGAIDDAMKKCREQGVQLVRDSHTGLVTPINPDCTLVSVFHTNQQDPVYANDHPLHSNMPMRSYPE